MSKTASFATAETLDHGHAAGSLRALIPDYSVWDPLAEHRPMGSRPCAQGAQGAPAKGRGKKVRANSDDRRDQSYRKTVAPRSPNQQALLDAIDQHHMIVALGPAGTGKTYLAIAKAVEALEAGKVERIVLSRPAVEAGENLGYLPGALEEKLAPYLRPLYDALTDRLGHKRLRHALSDGTIEIAPIAYMRGRTLNNATVVLDEAQNCTYGQLKMLITRLGWNSTMILTGDPDQSDLLPGVSGLADIAAKLATLEDVAVVQLRDHDIVRHPLVASMLSVV